MNCVNCGRYFDYLSDFDNECDDCLNGVTPVGGTAQYYEEKDVEESEDWKNEEYKSSPEIEDTDSGEEDNEYSEEHEGDDWNIEETERISQEEVDREIYEEDIPIIILPEIKPIDVRAVMIYDEEEQEEGFLERVLRVIGRLFTW